MDNGELLALAWIHVIAMAYWLGGEWGVFNSSRFVTHPELSIEERARHMETAYRIDILPRTAIILMLPLGLHMGNKLGIQPLGGPWLVGIWVAVACWLVLTWSAYARRGTDLGLRLTRMDEAIRYALIPALVVAAVASLGWGRPFTARWYDVKVLLYAGLLVIGLGLRFIMRDWVIQFRRLRSEGSTPEVEGNLARSMGQARRLAYVYWVGIMTVAGFGVFQPGL